MEVASSGLRQAQRQAAATFFRSCRERSLSAPRHSPGTNSNIPIRGGAVSSWRAHPYWRSDRTATRRQFSSSAPVRATVVRQNPRTDDEGQDMTIEISERAAKRLRQITNSPPSVNTLSKAMSAAPDSHLRVTVTSGGCHGFQYLMSLESASQIDLEEDTVFEAPREEGSEPGTAEVVMDAASLELLKGSVIDYTTELIGSQFKIVGNPRAKSSCGCGTSFDID